LFVRWLAEPHEVWREDELRLQAEMKEQEEKKVAAEEQDREAVRELKRLRKEAERDARMVEREGKRAEKR